MRCVERNRDLTSISALLLGYLPNESPQLPHRKERGNSIIIHKKPRCTKPGSYFLPALLSTTFRNVERVSTITLRAVLLRCQDITIYCRDNDVQPVQLILLSWCLEQTVFLRG